MIDPYGPTDEELRRWAAADADAPVEDFDLMVATVDYIPILLELVSTPKRCFAFDCLEIVIDDAVRTHFNTATREQVELALTHAEEAASRDEDIASWVARSRARLRDV